MLCCLQEAEMDALREDVAPPGWLSRCRGRRRVSATCARRCAACCGAVPAASVALPGQVRLPQRPAARHVCRHRRLQRAERHLGHTWHWHELHGAQHGCPTLMAAAWWCRGHGRGDSAADHSSHAGRHSIHTAAGAADRRAGGRATGVRACVRGLPLSGTLSAHESSMHQAR
ncbi:hypothetical protein COO60DRAFT_1082906 [Scenedesmus sp. NREL 46B-D3]|nr:hypothetical protein COO60DRAFT_1082906 [Scenedesmus sp. NREL 46B-D3]